MADTSLANGGNSRTHACAPRLRRPTIPSLGHSTLKSRDTRKRNTSSKAGRHRVAAGTWKRTGADGRTPYEITYRDSDGRIRHVVEGGKRAAETALADLKARIGHGERIAHATP
jgi:hypothetical protein